MFHDIELVRDAEGDPRVSTATIAEHSEVQHKNVLELVRKNIEDFEDFGRVAFETRTFDTLGGPQKREVAMLNEPQSTLLITFLRNTAIVKAFKKALVKAFYDMRRQLAASVDERVPQSLPEALRAYAREVEAREAVEAYAKQLEPKADAYSAFMDADGTQSIGNVAKMLGLSQNKLFALLRNAGVLIAKGHMRNTPYQQYMHHFKVTPYTYERRDGSLGASYTTTVQTSGVDFIRRKLGIPHMQLEVPA